MHSLPYELIRSRKRRRTISLHIKEGGRVVVYAPFRTPLSEIEELIQRKRSWISEKLSEKQRIAKSTEKQFLPGEAFLYLGEPYPLEIDDGVEPKRPLTLSFGKFVLNRSCAEKARSLFIEWYKKESRRTLAERADYYSRRLELFPSGLRITGAQFRWGSCSRDNRLCFSWRIVMAPLKVVDYVLIHELVHIKEKNHSARFWNHVESIMPDYKKHRLWLREHEHSLQL